MNNVLQGFRFGVCYIDDEKRWEAHAKRLELSSIYPNILLVTITSTSTQAKDSVLKDLLLSNSTTMQLSLVTLSNHWVYCDISTAVRRFYSRVYTELFAMYYHFKKKFILPNMRISCQDSKVGTISNHLGCPVKVSNKFSKETSFSASFLRILACI